MNWRIGFILGCIGIALVFLLWRPFSADRSGIEGLDPQDLQPDFVAEGLFTRIYASSGDLQHQVESVRMAHYSILNLTELTEPVYITTIAHDDGSHERWRVSADEGRYYDDERLVLERNVRIINEDNTSFVQAIETEYLTINTEQQIISTDQPVLIYGPQFEVRGNGLTARLDEQYLELNQHVQTVYYPERAAQ